jgi:mannose/fructose-specific phosphotransferase system component IIA
MIKKSLTLGLIEAGCEVLDIGLCLSPVAYYAQFALDAPAVAMVTASHNENGWTGVKMGANRPLTFGPDEMGKLKDIVLGGKFVPREGGKLTYIDGMREKYIKALVGDFKLKNPIKVIAACGNGAAGAYSPDALRMMGAEVIEMDCNLDYTFPKYNPNPEDIEMLHSMAELVRETGADVAFGFDGKQVQMTPISIGPDDDMTVRRDDILAACVAADTGEGVIILTDMFGGTPSNLAISIMERGNYEVIAGANLPMLIKLAEVRKTQSIARAAFAAQDAARKYIAVVSSLLAN